jgi:nitrogen fixation protein NifU and related proteins
MSGEELAAPLGPLPPVKIHCTQLVEDALRNALTGQVGEKNPTSPTLLESFAKSSESKNKTKVILATDKHR